MLRKASWPGRWLALGLAVLSSACAGVTTRTALTDANRNAIRSSRTVANVSQEEVGVSINASNTTGAMGGGLLFALIDAGVNNARGKNAEAAAAPIRTAMVGYDVRASVEAALKRQLAAFPLLEATVLEQRREAKLDRSRVESLLDQYGEDAVMLVDFDYRFSAGFEHVLVTSVASFFPTRKASSPELARLAEAPPTEAGYPRPLLYRATFMSTSPVPEGQGTPAQRWAADDGAAARQTIDACVDEVVRLLVWDIQQPAPRDGYAVSSAKPIVYKELGQRQWYVVSTENGRTWLRASSGELASVLSSGAAPVAAAPAPNVPAANAPAASAPAPDASGAKAAEPTVKKETSEAKPAGARPSVTAEMRQPWDKDITGVKSTEPTAEKKPSEAKPEDLKKLRSGDMTQPWDKQ